MQLLTQVRDRLSHAVGFGTRTAEPKTERRQPTRLKEGDTRPCPSCAAVLEFHESYRVWRTDRNTMEPAWACHRHPCTFREFVRH